MNYQNIYQLLIAKALTRVIPDTIYTEKHHIVPVSMGGLDCDSNIACLTAKEHFVAHHLLWKIYRNKEMAHAFMLMCHTERGGQKFKINAKEYQLLKEDNRKFRSEFMTGRPGNNLGKTLPQEWRDNISKGQKGHRRGNGGSCGFTGKNWSEEQKKAISEKRKGKPTRTGIPFTEEAKKKMSENRKGKTKQPWSEERKAAASARLSGKKRGPYKKK